MSFALGLFLGAIATIFLTANPVVTGAPTPPLTAGAPAIFILSGVLTASLAALALMHPVIRNLDRAGIAQVAQSET